MFKKQNENRQLPKLPVQKNAATQQNVAQKKSEKIAQTASPFHSMPKELQMQIFRKLNDNERMKFARTCKEFNETADSNEMWKIEYISMTNAAVDNKTEVDFKTLYKNSVKFTSSDMDYYVVGHNIHCTETRGFNPYPQYRTKYTKVELEKAFPKNSIMVFENLEDAKNYAASKQGPIEYHRVESASPIFRVHLKSGRKIDNIKSEVEESQILSRLLPRKEKSKKTITYFQVATSAVEKILSAKMSVGDHAEVDFAENSQQCVIS